MNEFVIHFIKLLILFIPLFFIFSFIVYSLRGKFSINKVVQKTPLFFRSLIAALLGALTPFCVCLTMPIFINMLEAGIDPGSAVSFLIASPLVSISAALLIMSMFGVKFVIYYAASAVAIAVLGGIVVSRFKINTPLQNGDDKPNEVKRLDCCADTPLMAAFSLLKKLILYLIMGAAIGAFLHNYMPLALVEKINSFPIGFSIPLVALIGFPLYANALIVIPICFSLAAKGVNSGIIVTFLMSSTGICLPTIIILSKIFNKQALAVFLLITFLAYLCVGYIFYFFC